MVYEFEQAAINGAEMPSGLSGPDQWMFLSLRLLYQSVRAGIIDREKGLREKRGLERAYNTMLADQKYLKYIHGLYNKINAAGMKYRADKTLDNAEAFYQAVYKEVPEKEETT